jgi:replication factor A1
LIILLELRVVIQSTDKIGEPTQLATDGAGGQPEGASAGNTPGPGASTSVPKPPSAAPSKAPSGPQRNTYPIEGLSPYQNNWTIKARVINKSEMRTWSNSSGEGKLFNVTFADDTGEIRGTGFNLVADDLYPKLEEGKVYYVSKARVNLAKKKFSHVNNDYELNFERYTEIEEVRFICLAMAL